MSEPTHQNQSLKIAFAFHSDLLKKWTIETIWAEVVDQELGYYALDNIPFYATGVACGDVVRAEYDEDEERLMFREVIKPSGHSTIQVFMAGGPPDKKAIRDALATMGVESEDFNEQFFVADVPPDVDYVPVKKYLQQQEQAGILFYAEPCLSSAHFYE